MLTRNQSNDTWLTPPQLIEALGKFDLDPCAPPNMPWQTAKRMVALPEDGLQVRWKGRVWLNPPYSDPLPWVEKFFENGRGVMLVPARSPETKWGQLTLQRGTAVLFLKGRILFHHWPGGEVSVGKYLPNMLVAASERDAAALQRIAKGAYPGVILRGAP